MIGFFFTNRHSREFNVAVMEDASRGLLPALRRNDYEITGRHGTIDFGNETYNTRRIIVDICFISQDEQNLQVLAREIAHWLSGKGLLYFDDEPDKAYDAVVYQAVDTEQLIRAKRAPVIFECQPFAKTINFLQSVNPNTGNGDMIPIYSNGTQSTPAIITIRNTGSTGINNIRIIRGAMYR